MNYATGGRRTSRRSTPNPRTWPDEQILRGEAQAEANATGTTVAGFTPQYRGLPKAAAHDKRRAETFRREIKRRGLEVTR